MKIAKGSLIETLAKKTKSSKRLTGDFLNLLLKEITSALKKGKKVVLTDFGTFSVAKRSARTGRNPRTGATLNIPARKVAKFKAGRGLKKAVRKAAR